MSKTALITGITGMDGAYLTPQLLAQGYKVFGGVRRNAQPNTGRLQEVGVVDQVEFVPMEMLEYENIRRTIAKVKPDVIYHLASQSFVHASFEEPIYTTDVVAMGTTRLLEAIRSVKPDTKMYEASSSEMFGKVQQVPQNEETKFYPRSPYAVAKVAAHQMCVNYRESYGMFVVNGILFNHEGEFRGLEFLPRKITSGLAKIKAKKMSILGVGNLDSRRDWGYAADYTRAMTLMMDQPTAEDWVIATGETHTVREFIELAGAVAGMQINWEGEGVHEFGWDAKTGEKVIYVDPQFYRPCEVDLLVGDSTKARTRLGWTPSVDFPGLVELMMKADLKREGVTI